MPSPNLATASPGHKATLRVLGPLLIGPDRPGTRPHLREKAQELAVYLACRPDGADVATISEILFPDSTVANSKTSVQQAASSLRKVLQFHNMHPDNPILLIGGDRYRLNPNVVTVDLWHLHEHARAAAATTDPERRRAHLEDAVALGTSVLGDGLDNDWIDSYRVTATVAGVEARLRLADELTAIDPQRASSLLADAITIDPTNEGLYRRRMRVLDALGDTGQIPALLRDLTRALADIDAQPEPATTELAAHLLQHKMSGLPPPNPRAATGSRPSHESNRSAAVR